MGTVVEPDDEPFPVAPGRLKDDQTLALPPIDAVCRGAERTAAAARVAGFTAAPACSGANRPDDREDGGAIGVCCCCKGGDVVLELLPLVLPLLSLPRPYRLPVIGLSSSLAS